MGEHHHHDHAALSDKGLDSRLWLTLLLNIAITSAEFIGGLITGSLALLSDAVHNLSDVAAVLLALIARRMSRRPPTLHHSYGFKRLEVLSAMINALVLVVITAFIAYASVLRLLHPEKIHQGPMLWIALFAFAANLASVLLLQKHDGDDVNVRGAYLHMAQDAAGSLAVVVAALLLNTPLGPYVDALVALLVGLFIMRSALSLVWKTLRTVLEGVPADVDLQVLADKIAAQFAPSKMHHLHVWEIGPKQRLLTAHLQLGCDMEMREVEKKLNKIKDFLKEHWHIDHATIEPELQGCAHQEELLGQWEQAADATSHEH